MRHIISSIAFALLFVAFGQTAFAQAKFASKVQKAILSVNTYDKNGNQLNTGTGFYIGANGEAMADYRIFKGAHKANVIDASGKQLEVDCILGADDTYSLVRFRVNTKGNAMLTPVTSVQSKGSNLYAVGYAKSAAPSDFSAIGDTAMIEGKYVYYALGKTLDSKLLGAPVFNEAGNLVGILHAPIAGKSFVMDIRYREKLKMEAIGSRSASVALGNIFIPKGLPDSAEEALVYIYFKSNSASNTEYLDMLNRFIAAHPENAEGYNRRSVAYVDLTRFDEADADLKKYLSLVADKAIGNSVVATNIYNKLHLQPTPAYDKWSYDLALEHVNKAIDLNQQSSTGAEEKKINDIKYKVLKAQILSDKGNYDEAIALYEEMNQGESKTPSFLYAISMAREGRGDSIAACIEPLDSAIVEFGEPLPREASTFIMRRGQLYANSGKYREAVADYNQYCYLMNNQVNDRFYYERSQIEVNARMYQQAIEDINKAIDLAPRAPLYYIEKAAITIRVNMLDECIAACQKAISLNPSIIDSYRILGYAQLQKGDKANARINLQKAIDMGDENAKKIMETYIK